MKSFKHILIGTLVVLVLIAVLQNRQTVDTKFLFATVSMPRALLLLVTLGIGFAAGVLTGSKFFVRKSR